MKQGHAEILFTIVFMICFLVLLWEQKKYDGTQSEKQKIESALLEAMEYTGREFETVLFETQEKKQQFFEQSFFNALYVFLDALDDKEKQEILWMHIPLLALVEEDGVSFNYAVEEQERGSAGLLREWSGKTRFVYPEGYTEEQKKILIAETLEEAASVIISKHNYIAAQYGISYRFYVPDFLGNTEEAPEFPMLIVVFQGWPLTAAGDVTYENCMDAAVFLRRKEPKATMPDGIPYKETT